MSQAKIESLLDAALTRLGFAQPFTYKVDVPPRPEMGDYAANAAIAGAKRLARKPLELARQISAAIEALDKEKIFRKIEIAGPGFINF